MARFLLALALVAAVSSHQFWSEDFSSTAGFTMTDSQGNAQKLFSDGSKDYICIYGNDDSAAYSKGKGCPGAVTNSPNWTPLKNEESSFLAFEDIDGEGALIPMTFTWSNIDVTGADELTFSGKFYNSDTSTMKWDRYDYVKLTAIQGSAKTELVHITMDPTHGDAYNAFPYDIAQSPAVKLHSKVVTAIRKTFAVKSDEPLTLTLEIKCDAGEEEMGIAALALEGEKAVPNANDTCAQCKIINGLLVVTHIDKSFNVSPHPQWGDHRCYVDTQHKCTCECF